MIPNSSKEKPILQNNISANTDDSLKFVNDTVEKLKEEINDICAFSSSSKKANSNDASLKNINEIVFPLK